MAPPPSLLYKSGVMQRAGHTRNFAPLRQERPRIRSEKPLKTPILYSTLLQETARIKKVNRMMLQHSGPSLADISCSALVPCLSPPGTLTLDDFTGFSPLVKEELRLTIQSKRLSHGLSADVSSDGASSSSERLSEHLQTSGTSGKRELAPEELERRRRRRERNKIAAAKCRNKKKEKTESLQQESEKLETVNADLKAQIEELKQQKQQLVYMLNLHRPTCIVRAQNGHTPEDERNLFLQHVRESALQLQNLTASLSTETHAAAAVTTTTSTIDASELLSLDHVHCSSHR